ncbi:MAG: nicotinate-nucleotide--dimethylbenzimidazole phosphoribosyltransferase [Pseudomonadota bacterium]
MRDDHEFAEALQRFIDQKTKPQGALGRIEAVAKQLGQLQATLRPKLETLDHFIFAADHGIAEDGVSAYPQAVTAQMVQNFLAGGAAATVFANSIGARVTIVDAGTATPVAHPDLLLRRQGAGTANFRLGPAMSASVRDAAWAAGHALGTAAAGDAVALGEMGIANTSAAALLAHKIADIPLDRLVGRGTGLDDPGLARKRALLAEAAARTGALTAEAALAEYGGFEIVMMAGAMAGAAETDKAVLVDGFIATAAALAVLDRRPALRPAFFFCHRSAEAGHDAMLSALQAEPLLDLGLRLGEGTGALLAWPLIRAAAAMMRDMASFADAGVSESDS